MINLVNRRCRELLLRTGTPHEATQDQNGAQFAVELRNVVPKDNICELFVCCLFVICELIPLFVCLFVCVLQITTSLPFSRQCQCP